MQKDKIFLCPYCGEEAGSIGSIDDAWDYCHECEKVIEGETIVEKNNND